MCSRSVLKENKTEEIFENHNLFLRFISRIHNKKVERKEQNI